jgi:hypothetical protein
MKRILLIFFLAISLTSCVAVKEYDKVYLNDEEMQLAIKSMEAASGGNGGKTGGGCGCN